MTPKKDMPPHGEQENNGKRRIRTCAQGMALPKNI